LGALSLCQLVLAASTACIDYRPIDHNLFNDKISQPALLLLLVVLFI
jgi:hypothetical protein